MLLEQKPAEQKKIVPQKPWPTIGGKRHEASFMRIAMHHGLSGETCLADLEHLVCLVHTTEEPSKLIERWKNYRLITEAERQRLTKTPDSARKCAERKIEQEFKEYEKISGLKTKKEVITRHFNDEKDTFVRDMTNLFYNINVDTSQQLNCRELPSETMKKLKEQTEDVKKRLREKLDDLGLKDKPVSLELCQIIVAVANRDELPPKLQEKIFGLGQS